MYCEMFNEVEYVLLCANFIVEISPLFCSNYVRISHTLSYWEKGFGPKAEAGGREWAK